MIVAYYEDVAESEPILTMYSNGWRPVYHAGALIGLNGEHRVVRRVENRPDHDTILVVLEPKR